MPVCYICGNSKLLSSWQFNGKFYCRECASTVKTTNCVDCGNIKSLKPERIIGYVECCVTCENQEKIICESIVENILINFENFKKLFPLFSKISFPSENEMNILFNKLSNVKDSPDEISNTFDNFLNNKDIGFKMLNTKQTVKIFDWISSNVKYSDGTTELCHKLFPCVLDHYELMKSNCKFQDCLYYYRFSTLNELYFIWSWCRLSKFNKNCNFIKNDICYVCLEEIDNFRTGKLGGGIVRGFKNKFVICLCCGKIVHLECVKSNSCGICKSNFTNFNTYMTLDQEHMLIYMPSKFKKQNLT